MIQNQVFPWHATLIKQQYLEGGSVSKAEFTWFCWACWIRAWGIGKTGITIAASVLALLNGRPKLADSSLSALEGSLMDSWVALKKCISSLTAMGPLNLQRPMDTDENRGQGWSLLTFPATTAEMGLLWQLASFLHLRLMTRIRMSM